FGNDNTITALNAEGIVWNVTVNNGIGSVMAIDNENGLLYAVDQNGTLFSYDVNDAGAEVEVYNIGANATSIIVDGDSKVYVSDDAGNVWAFDSEGNLLWNLSLSAPVKAQLAMDNNGVIYAVTANTLYAIGYRNELAIEVTVSEGEYNVLDNVTITATLNETTEGNVIFTINGKNTTVAINGTVAELTTTIPGGNQTIVATFEGNDAYMPATGNATVDIAKLDVEFENVPEEISMEEFAFFNFNLIQNNTAISVGTNSFKVYKNDEELSKNNYDIYNGFELDLWDISSGSYNMAIAFVGNDIYNPVNATFSLTVLPRVSANVVVSDDDMAVDVKIGDSVYPYNVLSDATGKFTVIANNETIAEGTIENGAGSVTFDKLEPGTYDIIVAYEGDDNYLANNGTVSVKIPRTSQWPSVGGNPQNSGIANATREDCVSIIWEAALNGDLRSSAIIDGLGNIYVNDGSKIYSFTSNGTLRWSGGIGSAGIALYKDELVLAPQYHNAMMIYNATTGAAINGNFWSASSNFAPITGPDGRIYTPTDYGYPADGQGWSGNYWISVFDETGYEWEPYGFNLFLVEITGVGYGSQALKASPSFDKLGYIYANTVKGFKIVNIATGATVFSDTNINGVGRPVIDSNNIAYILDATLNGIYAISTEGILWNATVSDAIGTTLAVDNENGFLYAVNANGTLYKYDTTDGSESLVYELNSTGVSIILDADSNVYVSTAAGDVVAISADGELLWTINLGSKVTGQLAMDNNGIIYAVADKTLYALGFDANMTVAGENVTVFDNEIITVTISAEGNVTISFNGEETEVPVENGTATLDLGQLPAGTYTVSVTYDGDGITYGPAFAETTFEIIKADAEITEDIVASVENSTLTLTLPEDATGIVLAKVDGKGYYAEIENGTAVIEIPELAPGKYPVDITYLGDDNYNNASLATELEVPEEPVVEPEDANVTADVNGSDVSVELPEDAEGYVVVSVDGKKYYFDADDEIALDLSDLAPGEYPVEITYSGDDKYASSTVNTTVTVPEVVPEDANVTADVNGSDVSVELPEDAEGYVVVSVD
ncbi:MAG: PQQ-binding-like beta-propeller repeat protein, partial [Methanobrevibacter sp.]|nr:PQQ-binding-like beta-propeller repeat protein [Methanobrevibacter sp.]